MMRAVARFSDTVLSTPKLTIAKFASHEEADNMRKRRKPRGAAFADFYTRRDIEKLLGISPSAISRMETAGKLPPSTYFGGVRLYRKGDVDAWLKEITQVRQLPEPKPVLPKPKNKK
jgi:predicted DNA-binding transcriptional regulator AlpA